MQTVFDVTKGADYRAAFDLIPESRVKAILSTNWSGQMFSDRVWDNTNALADGLKHDMLVGIMAGKSEQHMADDIMNRCGVGAFEARRLVRTETTCVANMAELDGYRELDIDEYEFSACLDSRTSDLCRELDGKVFKRNSAQAGVNLPPMHPFCRSTTLPVLPSEEDLDKELAELGDEIGADVDFDEWERNLQQGEDGKWRYVAGSAGKPMRFAVNGVDKSDESDIITGGSVLDDIKKIESVLDNDENLKLVNPHYGEEGFVQNCANCSLAFEARKRGFDVEALPTQRPMFIDDYEKMFVDSGFSYILNPMSEKETLELIEETIKSWGEGARGTIFIVWKNVSVGHFFSCEVKNNSIVYCDAQRSIMNAKEYFKKSDIMHTAFMRTDNLEFSSNVERAFKERK